MAAVSAPPGRRVSYGVAYRTPRWPARFALATLALAFLAHLAVLVMDVVSVLALGTAIDDPGSTRAADRVDLRDDLARAALALYLASVLVAGIAMMIWTSRMYRNTEALAPGQKRYSTYWGWLGWLVPVMAFFRPKQVINDIWRSLHDGAWPPVWVTLWWALWLATEIGRRIQEALPRDTIASYRTYDTIDAVAATFALVGIALAIRLVRHLTQQQEAQSTRVGPSAQFVPELTRAEPDEALRGEGFTIQPGWAPGDAK